MNNSNSIKRIAIVGPESTGKSELAAALASFYKTLWVKEYAREYLNSLSRNYIYDDLIAIAKGQMQEEDKLAEMIGGDTNHGQPAQMDGGDANRGQNKIYGELKKLQTPNPKPQSIFCDTNLSVIKIWSEFKYGKCDEWIANEIKMRKYFFHLLTDIDLPWQPDPQREHPHERKKLFDIYHNELKNQQVDFEIVSGIGDKRIEKAISILDNKIRLLTF